MAATFPPTVARISCVGSSGTWGVARITAPVEVSDAGPVGAGVSTGAGTEVAVVLALLSSGVPVAADVQASASSSRAAKPSPICPLFAAMATCRTVELAPGCPTLLLYYESLTDMDGLSWLQAQIRLRSMMRRALNWVRSNSPAGFNSTATPTPMARLSSAAIRSRSGSSAEGSYSLPK